MYRSVHLLLKGTDVEVHTYDTVTLPVTNLTLQHTLVGKSGGLSAVYNVEDGMGLDDVIVETEHGYLSFGPYDEVEVLA